MTYQRPTLASMPPAIHGARDYSELKQLGLEPDDLIDFSANSNPYGPYPALLSAVKQAVTGATLARYPDRDCLALREAAARVEGVSPAHLLPTNGASELIQLIALAFVEPGSRHLVVAPTFGEYQRAIQLVGGQIHQHWPTQAHLRFEVEAVIDEINRIDPQGVWLCTPNNPTGQQWEPNQIERLQAAAPHCLWVIDESYRYFGQRTFAGSTPPAPPTGIIVRSLTKAYGLAGLRLGYGVAAPDVVKTLQAVQPPWSVNSLAQVAGVVALQPNGLRWREESLARLQHHATQLWKELATLGFTVLPTDTPFALVAVEDAPSFRRTLLHHGLLVRDCTSVGLPHHIRIAAQLPEENERLLTAIEGLL